MKDFKKLLSKYVVLCIVLSIYAISIPYIRKLLLMRLVNSYDIIDLIQTTLYIVIKLIIIVLLIIDFKKHKLKNIVITCFAAFFSPILGVLIFVIMLFEKNQNKNSSCLT